MNSHQDGQNSSLPLIVVACAVLQILTPLLPNLGLGQPIGDRSDNVDTLITPAGWAFSIWGPLYAGSIAFAIYQALPAQRNSPLLAGMRGPAAGAFLGNALWALYTQFFGLNIGSAAIIVATLACLLMIYRRLAHWQPRFTTAERWLVVLPLSTLAAWLTAATIVNIAATLRYHGVEAGDAAPVVAATIVVVGGFIVAAALVRGRGNPFYALVFLWALAAIFAAGGQESDAVAVAAGIAALLVLGGAFLGLRGEASRWLTS